MFTDSTAHRCTSNNQSWTVARTGDPQPPRKPVIDPGSYRGLAAGATPTMTFSVSAGGSSAVNISIKDVHIRACTPPGAFPCTEPFGS